MALLIFLARNNSSMACKDGDGEYIGEKKLTQLISPDLGKLNKINFRLMTFGDGIIAGWRDGGLHRSGQQTAFSNLVAHQMGIANFTSPLFDPTEANGTGYLKLSVTSSGPKWEKVTTGLASLSQSDPPDLSAYKGVEVHNLGVPKLNRGSLSGLPSPADKGWVYSDTQKGYAEAMPYFWRIASSIDRSRTSYFDKMMDLFGQKSLDLALISFGYDELIDNVVKSEHTTLGQAMANGINKALALEIALKAKNNGVESVVFTLPDFKHLAYFNWFILSDLKRAKGRVTIFRKRKNFLGSEQLNGEMLFLPTPAVSEMFERARRGETFTVTLNDSDVVDTGELEGGSPTAYNQRLRKEAATANVPVVDLEDLFAKIYAGTYNTDDGLKIDGSPTGNFFSADGLYPSAIGNAVIANETIKVINRHYQAQIPVVNVQAFSQSLGK